MLRLLRPPLAAAFLRSFRLHSPPGLRPGTDRNLSLHKIWLLARVALVTASMTQTAS